MATIYALRNFGERASATAVGALLPYVVQGDSERHKGCEK